MLLVAILAPQISVRASREQLRIDADVVAVLVLQVGVLVTLEAGGIICAGGRGKTEHHGQKGRD